MKKNVYNPRYVYDVKEGDTVYWNSDFRDNSPLFVTKVTKKHIVCTMIRFYRSTGNQVKRNGVSYITVCEV